jgi:4-hydroxy-3-polyprenylbenzoate decarboxylase
VDQDINLSDPVEVMWAVMTRFDAVKDVVFSRMELRGSAPAYGGVMGVDATMKPGYSEVLVMDPDIVEKVNRRWNEYGL